MSISKEQFEEDLKIISKKSDKNEKLAWVRKRKKMEELLTKLAPIEDAILKLIADKQPIVDDITELRKIMQKDCIHPEDMLVHHGKYIDCKFCNTKITINRPFVQE